MRYRALAGVLVTASVAACAPRAQPYRFTSPMLGYADVPAETLPSDHPPPRTSLRPVLAYGWQTDAQSGIRTTSARGIEITMPTASAAAADVVKQQGAARPVVWSRLPAPHLAIHGPALVASLPVRAVREPSDLRTLVGTRDTRDPYAIAIGWLDQLGIHVAAPDGPALVAWAASAGTLHEATEPATPGDILVFDRTDSDASADRIAIAIGRDARGVTEFVYAGGGVIRRGFLDPRRPSTRRDLDGVAVNTFLRHGRRWPPKGTRYLAGELLAHVIRATSWPSSDSNRH